MDERNSARICQAYAQRRIEKAKVTVKNIIFLERAAKLDTKTVRCVNCN